MKKILLFLLFGGYALIVILFSIHQYQEYQKSFDKIVPYSHTMETLPTETSLETEEVLPTETTLETEIIVEIPEHPEIAPPDPIPPPTEESFTIAPKPAISPTSDIPTIPTELAIESTAPPQVEILEETELIVNYPLNLNTATFEELCTLPEVGEVLANAIIDYRNQIGEFFNREQLLDVNGIGEYRYSVIAPLLMIENEQPMPVDDPEPEPIPFETEPPPPTEPPTIPYINLNTTTKEQLMCLPNCSEQIAETIITLRDGHIHTFSNPYEILYVSAIAKDVNISPELYYSWEEYLFVDDEGGKQLHLYSQTEPE